MSWSNWIYLGVGLGLGKEVVGYLRGQNSRGARRRGGEDACIEQLQQTQLGTSWHTK